MRLAGRLRTTYLLLNRFRHFHARMARRFASWETQLLEKSIPGLLEGTKPQALPEMPTEVHMLVGSQTWLMALWAARSFQWASGYAWRFVFQDDGTLSPRQIAGLQRLFPLGTVSSRSDADARMEDRLAEWPACLAARRAHFMFLKLFDPLFHSDSDRYILLDSDVLFFKKPTEMLDWVRTGKPIFLFNPDIGESYSVPVEALERHFGVKMLRRANAGLALIPREAVRLDVVEEYLSKFERESTHDLWLEQTAYALLASLYARSDLLPPSYEISFGPSRGSGSVARHYVGHRASRPHFFREGVIHLAPHLL